MTSKAGTSKKRKVSDEKRAFKETWKENFFFVDVKEKPVCLICNENVSVMKEFNIKRHYQTLHSSTFDQFSGQSRSDKVAQLQNKLQLQQKTFTRPSDESESAVKVSFIISEKIAAKSKPFSDGEFIKECIKFASEVLCPAQKSLFSKVSLSRNTVTRRIEELADDIERALKERAANFVFYSVALDESTDISDTAQLSIFIRGVDEQFCVTEEMAALFPMKGTTKGCDISEALFSTLQRFQLNFDNLAGAVTDGAPAMIGKNEGAIALLRKKVESCGNGEFFQYHCIIHQENLVAKHANLKDVMQYITNTVNFIRSQSLNHRQFQAFFRRSRI